MKKKYLQIKIHLKTENSSLHLNANEKQRIVSLDKIFIFYLIKYS